MQYKVNFNIDLARNPYDGRYIALEGVDGSGKTTQAKKLTEYFESKGRSVIAVREPRKEGYVGSLIQKALYGEIKLSAVAMQYLFSADRSLHHEEVIMPSLKNGNIVISDRCFWSAVVYGILDKTGGKYNNSDLNAFLIAQSILSMYHQFIVPDYTFYLKIPIGTAMERIKQEHKKREIYEEAAKLEKVINGYDWLAKKFSKEITVINGANGVREVTEEIVNKLT